MGWRPSWPSARSRRSPPARRAHETWLQPETLSKADTYNDAARLATNSPGVAGVIWTEFANGRTPRFRIRVSTREPDEKWAPSEQLSSAGEGGAGAVGVDPQGASRRSGTRRAR